MIYLDKNLKVTEVRVIDKDDSTQLKMIYDKVEYGKKYDKDYFDLDSIIDVNTNDNNNDTTNTPENNDNMTDNNDEQQEGNVTEDTTEQTEETATIEDIIYPMYLPTNTYLSDQEKLNTTNGQRLILTFEGDSPFTLVEETVTYSKEHEIIPTYGDLELLLDSVAIINDNSVNWISNGIEYYMVSDIMDTSEILEVARSISVLPVSK